MTPIEEEYEKRVRDSWIGIENRGELPPKLKYELKEYLIWRWQRMIQIAPQAVCIILGLPADANQLPLTFAEPPQHLVDLWVKQWLFAKVVELEARR